MEDWFPTDTDAELEAIVFRPTAQYSCRDAAEPFSRGDIGPRIRKEVAWAPGYESGISDKFAGEVFHEVRLQ